MDPWERRWVDYYTVLGLLPTADDEVVIAVYRRLARKYGSPGGTEPDESKFRLLNEAKDVLLDADVRARFDRARARRSSPSVSAPLESPDSRITKVANIDPHLKYSIRIATEADVLVDRSRSDYDLLHGLLAFGDIASVETAPAGPPTSRKERLVLLDNDARIGLKPILRITEVLAVLPELGLIPADTAALLAAAPDPRFDCGPALILAFGTVYRDSSSTRQFPRLHSGPTDRRCLIPSRYDGNVAFAMHENGETFTRVLAIRPPASQAALTAAAVSPALVPPSGQ